MGLSTIETMHAPNFTIKRIAVKPSNILKPGDFAVPWLASKKKRRRAQGDGVGRPCIVIGIRELFNLKIYVITVTICERKRSHSI